MEEKRFVQQTGNWRRELCSGSGGGSSPGVPGSARLTSGLPLQCVEPSRKEAATAAPGDAGTEPAQPAACRAVTASPKALLHTDIAAALVL